MPTTIYVRKDKGGLFADDEDSYKLIQKLPRGKVLKMTMTKPRNYKFLKKYFALVRASFDLVDGFPNQEAWRKFIQLKAGYFDILTFPDGGSLVEVKSISFAKMTEDEFNNLYDAACKVIIDTLPYDLDRERLDEIVRFSNDS